MNTSLISEEEPLLYVYGQNFTKWSYIAIDGEPLETFFLNEELLAAKELPKSKDGVYYITVQQRGGDENVLSETEGVEYRPEE